MNNLPDVRVQIGDEPDDSKNCLDCQESPSTDAMKVGLHHNQTTNEEETVHATVKNRVAVTPTSTSMIGVQAPPTWKTILKYLSRIVWGIVIILLLLQFSGQLALGHIKKANVHLKIEKPNLTVPTKITPQLNAEISASLDHALASAKSTASKELDAWKTEMMQRVDPKFLDWYFNYFNQLGIGLKGVWINLTVSSDEKKAEALIEDFQREFTKQVFQPELAQLELERMTRNAAKTYMSQLSRELSGIQSTYDIPQANWDRYLRGISITIFNSEGVQQELNLRDAIRGGGGLAAIPIIKAGTVVTTQVASKIAAKTATKAATKVATKTATKVATEAAGATTAGIIGLQLIDPLVGIGILIWDVWDHHHTVKIERPILKENIERYLTEVKNSLLENTSGSIMASIYQLDNELRQQLR